MAIGCNLSPRRQKFADQYALTGNGVQSAIAAGYAVNSAHVEASRLLRIAEVAAVVEAERARLREQSDLRADDVIRGLRRIAEDESAPHSARVQAWRHLGRHLGMFTDRIDVAHTLDVAPLAGFSLDELHAVRVALQQKAVVAEARVLDEGAGSS